MYLERCILIVGISIILIEAGSSTVPSTPSWDIIDPCIFSNFGYTTFLNGSYVNTVSYTLQAEEPENVESCTLTQGWYLYTSLDEITTEVPLPGQCGTMSPIYLQGSYPESGQNTMMTACMVGNNSSVCIETWNVTVKNCLGRPVTFMYLTPTTHCGGYCMGSDIIWPFEVTVPESQPCALVNLLDSTPTRSVDYTKQSGEFERCESTLLSGWYRFINYDRISTTPVVAGQCGSSAPIYLQGSYPTMHGTTSTMTACMVNSEGECKESWDVEVMNCGRRNMVYLVPSVKCGRYCMDPWVPSSSIGQCRRPSILYNYPTRNINYTRQPGEPDNCESQSTMPGWYRYDGYQIIPTQPVLSGQCGSSSPIYLQGSYSDHYGQNSILTACMVGNGTQCIETWNVTAVNCGGYNIVYLNQTEHCGRYCSEDGPSTVPSTPSDLKDPCIDSDHMYTTFLNASYINTVSYTLQAGEPDNVESCTLTQGWYRYINLHKIITEVPLPGQCGTMSPIYIQGIYPWYGQKSMTACMVGNSSSMCIETWKVEVKKCHSTIYMYLMPTAHCGGYCMVNERVTPSTVSGNEVCTLKNTIDSTHTRTVDYIKQPGEFERCESTLLSGWYRYSYYDNIATTPVVAGQCGSSTPIYLQGSYQTVFGTKSTMTACMVNSTGGCKESWDVEVMSCGMFSMVYLVPSTNCGRYCMDPWVPTSPLPSSSTGQCFNASVVYNNYTRDINHTRQLWEPDNCESQSVMPGWYRYDGNQIIPTQPVLSGQCGSSSPIYLQGSYPEHYGQSSILTACMVGNDTQCIETWNVTAVNCGEYNIVYLDQTEHCGRYCSVTHTTLKMEGSSTPIHASTVSDQPMSTAITTIETTTGSTAGINFDLIANMYMYVDPAVPTHDANSLDRQLMFECKLSYYNLDVSVLTNYNYDILWEIDDEEFTVKANLTWAEIKTDGRLKSSELTANGKTVGFNVKCGIRFSDFQVMANNSFLKAGSSYFVGIDIYPRTLSISSGESATIYVWVTVPVACKYDSSYPCKLVVEMVDFNEQFTSGSPKYCNESITELTKPSLCGLELNGWNTPWTWQSLTINLPENTAQDQEYIAKLNLRVSTSTEDPIWSNYRLPELSIYVVNENVTDDYWWWYGSCSSGTDPTFSTFDWQWYGFHDEGEYVLYRHKTKPIEVHTIQRRYESDHTWTENCAVAIRAASDVFIIYGCDRPTRWIVRREGCGIGSEYLEVYQRWGSYEITLPTGTRVYAWISMNRRINVFITLSRTDRDQTEGLCGTWNRNYDDDFTGRDGVVYQNSTPFARTWSVPTSDSLFIAKQRTEKLSQSFMYCSCLGETLDQLSPNVDCSWKESLPVCPPVNWGKEVCKVRNKRATDAEDDDAPLDVSPDVVSSTQQPEVNLDWKNGWNESHAKDVCNKHFNDSILFGPCSSLSNVNVSSAIDNCVINIKISGTEEYMADSFELLKVECSNEVRTNNTLYSDTNNDGKNVADLITENLCPFDCKYNSIKHGDCVEGFCNCYSGYTGDDCRVNMEAPPDIITELSNTSLCSSTASSCKYASVFGENFYESANLRCIVETAEIVNKEVTAKGTSTTVTGKMVNLGEVKCQLNSGSRRRKRSTTTQTSVEYYLVSVSNNGANYSGQVPVIIYNPTCNTCTISNSLVICKLRSDVCVIYGVCYAGTSSQCSTNTDSSTDSKLWIIGLVIGVLLCVIIVILLIKNCRKTRPATPLHGRSNDELQYTSPFGPCEQFSRPSSAHSPTEIDVQPMYSRTPANERDNNLT